MSLRKLSLALVMTALVAGCTSSPDPAPTPSAGGSPPPWKEPASYTYVLTRGCDAAKPVGRYQVKVTSGVAATERLDATTVTPSEGADEDLGPVTGETGEEIEAFTLSELVEMATTATDDGAEVSTSYDTTDGHPVKVSIDVGEGPECWNVSDYAVS